MRFAGRLLDLDDLVVHLGVAPGEECATVDYHVDLVRAVLDHPAHFVQFRLDGGLARRERRRDGCDFHARALDARDRGRDEIGIHTNGGDRRDAGIGRVRPDRLGRERRDFAGRVLTLERRQVHHSDRQL